MKGKEVETASNATTIVETVSATGKICPEVKISSEVLEKLFHYLL
jgi:hypothetical protein